MPLTIDLDLDATKMSQRDQYVGQRPSHPKPLSVHTDIHTHWTICSTWNTKYNIIIIAIVMTTMFMSLFSDDIRR